MTTSTRPSNAARSEVARRAQGGSGGAEVSLRQKVMQLSDSGQFRAALPLDIITPERFARVALTALSKNRDLEKCTHDSVLGALVTAAQLGLEVNTPLGQASLVPFREKGTMKCQLIIEYRGYVTLARRSGNIESLIARTVHEHDEFSVEYGLADTLTHKPLITGTRGAAVAWYAVAKYVGGGHSYVVMNRDEVEAHRKFSKNPDGPMWRDHYDAAARKTCIRELSKYLPMSVELARAVSADERTRTDLDLEAIDDRVFDGEVIEVNGETGEIVGGPAAIEGQAVTVDQATGEVTADVQVEDVPPGYGDLG